MKDLKRYKYSFEASYDNDKTYGKMEKHYPFSNTFLLQFGSICLLYVYIQWQDIQLLHNVCYLDHIQSTIPEKLIICLKDLNDNINEINQ